MTAQQWTRVALALALTLALALLLLTLTNVWPHGPELAPRHYAFKTWA
jgi:hypothetical protein